MSKLDTNAYWKNIYVVLPWPWLSQYFREAHAHRKEASGKWQLLLSTGGSVKDEGLKKQAQLLWYNLSWGFGRHFAYNH